MPKQLSLLLLIIVAKATTTTSPNKLSFNHPQQSSCFCQLSGRIIDECTCNIDTLDHFNNIKIYPRLRSLLTKNYFRFYKVNLKQKCPFWVDDSKCAMKFCHVEHCVQDNVPNGIKGADTRRKAKIYADEENCSQVENNGREMSKTADLAYLNTSLTLKNRQDFVLWTEHDEALDNNNFCVFDENDEEAEYVDLLLNPERYTGYKGASANRIWNSIYLENCFRPSSNSKYHFHNYIQTNKLNGMCLEERIYYRAISGLHTSINVHLCANYLLSDGATLTAPRGEWGPNLMEFQRRFAPETTNGEGPQWLRNLYFVYLLELRALAKAAPFLLKEQFYTGDQHEDFDTQMAIRDLLGVIQQFDQHFDESVMFAAEDDETKRLKQEFRLHFRNVTRIMDCVGCDKCKLWGKLQTRGLGTALKILFTAPTAKSKNKLQLQREEIVALFNAFGRLSTSIYKLDDFRQMLN